MTGFAELPLVYLDLEFLGLDPQRHDIVEIALLAPGDFLPAECQEVIPGWRAWNRKVLPRRESADPKAVEINGYDRRTWVEQGAIGYAEMCEFLCEHFFFPENDSGWMKSRAMVAGHNVHSDVKFIEAALFPRKLDIKYRLDTVSLIWSELVPLGLTRGALEGACSVCGISNEGAHSALPDVLRTKALVDLLTDPAFAVVRPVVKRNIEQLEASRANSR